MFPSIQNRKQYEDFCIFIGILSALLCVLIFWGGISELIFRWSNQEEYSHGFFLPLISIWLLWKRRDAIRESLGSPSIVGVFVLLLALIMFVVGEFSALFLLTQLGFVIALFGIVISLGGLPLFKVCFAPIFFLFFAIPLPYFLDSMLSWRMQIVSSELGVGFIKLLGIAVLLEGNIIDLGHYKLQVVDACSGLRYLYPLFSLGVMVAYIFQAPMWQRVFVVLATIPITIFMNSFRIGMVGVLVEYWGGDMADGLLHYFEGWIIFIACGLWLAGVIWLLTLFTSNKTFNEVLFLPKLTVPQISTFKIQKAKTLSAILVLSTVIASVGAVSLSAREEVLPERKRFVSFPREIASWQGAASYLQPRIEHALGLDDYILSNYSTEQSTAPINFYVAYYSSQRKGVSPHSPRVCIPGGGWVISSIDETEISVPKSNLDIPVNRVIIERDGVKQIVYYWFSQRGKNIANEFEVKWHLFKDAVFENRTDGALIRLTTPVMKDETVQQADQRVKDFFNAVQPTLKNYLPEA